MVIEQKFKPGEEPDPTEYLFISMEMRMKDQAIPYDTKKDCWVPDPEGGFLKGEITGAKGELIMVKTHGQEEKPFKKDLVAQVNPPKYEKTEDMSNLTYLNDASVLYNLKSRYVNKLIYTYSGLFCIAINPYKRYPIYTIRAMKIYIGKRRNEVPPHIFAIADGAYTEMIQNHQNQSILITGESGAGKTENTKKVIAYFANVGATDKKSSVKKVSLEDQIVQTNPVLEAFGNAKTTRNDNSSRFGKFIRIHFSPNGKLAGADIETYLLEKARVVSQMALERSYHIFYLLMSGSVPGVKEMTCLSNDIYDYHFVSQGKTTIPGIDDGEEFIATHEAFEVLGFTDTERDNVYKITATVMHMGEMKFKQKGREEQAEADGTVEGERIAKMLGISHEDLYRNFTKPKIKVGAEFVTKGQNRDQCLYAVSAMAKAIFDRNFLFLVKKCNETLDTKQNRAQFIGVLDIAGFEIFEYNGFEQICINFTNEKLQQFFNHHMFVLEQEEYKTEGLDWIFEDFGMDLAACIELMERPMGVFAILEEQSMFPKATDQTFIDMLRTNHLGKSPCFIKPKPPKPGVPEAHFACVHYAGTVPYSITGWLEKNKDPLNETVIDMFKKAPNELIVELFANHPGQSAGPDTAGGKGKKKGGFSTVSSSYREQLNSLMTTLKATHPHFIRCIIPNEVKTPGLLDQGLVMHQLTCNGVLEGIRICRKGFPNRMQYADFKFRYLVLAPTEMKAEKENKAMAQALFKKIELDTDKWRVGHTKVFFRAGVLGELEDIRDEKVAKLVTWLQSSCRSYNALKNYQVYKEQRIGLQVMQRSIRGYMKLRTWAWFSLHKKIKPLLGASKAADIIAKLEEKSVKMQEAVDKEIETRKKLEEDNVKILEAKQLIMEKLDQNKEIIGEFQHKMEKAVNEKTTLETQLTDASERFAREEENCAKLQQEKKKLDQELNGLKKDQEDLDIQLNKMEGEKNTKDHQMRNLNDEIARQDEAINKLNKEKKHFQEQNAKQMEELQASEDKVNHLNKVKAKLQQTMDELEDSLEREKRVKGEMEKSKRKIEGDLKLTNEAIGDLEKNKRELEQTIVRKDRDISGHATKLEEMQSVVAKLQRQIKELQARIEEREEELESERQARAKNEKQAMDMQREIDEITERLDEAGGATAAQIELNRKREAELAKLRRDIEENKIQHERSLQSVRTKNIEAVTEMAEQIDALNKMKAKTEKDKSGMYSEINDIRHAMDQMSNEKCAHDKLNKNLQHEINELQSRLDEASRTFSDISTQKNRIATENSDLSRQLEDGLSQIAQLNKLKIQLSGQLEETKKRADDELRERTMLVSKFRNVEHELDSLRVNMSEEEAEKADLIRQLAKASADANLWRIKYQTEGVAKAEELEEAKHKLQCRLAEAEDTVESLNQKVMAQEKARYKLAGELDDTQIALEKTRAQQSSLEKKEKAFDKLLADWKSKVDELTGELDLSQRECRNISTELFRIKSVHDEIIEQFDSVRRENKNLGDEIKDLMDQIGDGGRNIHELDKARKRIEQENNELQAALEEAEAAVEQEENKALQGTLELSQAKEEIDRRIREKEEEFDNTRKNQLRQLESIQATLESEVKAKSEALRIKKKLEMDINELEVALEHSNRANADAQKSIKKYMQQIKEMQAQIEDEQRAKDEAREAFDMAERRANALTHEVEEARTLVEITDKARRNAEHELSINHEQLADFDAQSASLQSAKRKLESELQTLHADLDEILNESRNSEEKAKKAMVDAARLADELRAEQENSRQQELGRKSQETQVKELQVKLDEIEINAHKWSKKAIQKLEERLRQLEGDLDGEQRRGGETFKNLRRNERLTKELMFKADEDRKHYERTQDLVDKLQQKIKTYKSQIEEAEEIAAMNLSKFRKAQSELEEACERADIAEQGLAKLRGKARGSSMLR